MTSGSRHGGQPSSPTPRVRLVDVAREAGLSKTTVSAALNDTGRLSPAVREKARETARRMGYRPNATARQLRAGRAKLIGYVVGEAVDARSVFLESPYFARLTGATAATALRRGYAMVLLPAGSLQSEWADLPLDAVVVTDPDADDRIVDDVLAAGIPVFSDRSVEGRPGAYWVDVDTEAAVRSALDHFHEQGARRPVLVVPDSTTRFHTEVFAAHREWCAEHGLPERVVRVGEAGNGPVVRAVETALTGDPAGRRPDALLVVAEASPPLVLAAARRHGYDVPGDLLLACVSEDVTAEHTEPPVTTLSLRPEAIAEAGIEHLVRVLEEGGREPAGTLVTTRLDVRASSVRQHG
ncbi:LacI family DNA-binding transcriptional regulator [Streptomyces gardneri]|uniref:LacI family DNA-binding transcriptional regulator n=1 Tax=Streptomyces gardneri TaxID=66892 RepID=UPI0006E3F408|nr:LacI family DNA-binding transcriptional regulator [Streptomyces gardneri]QPK49636.1 LacI family DNA-binding transcriptional regulator [Streptomyces gardneri]WRK41188.1 LacI family DNA-binding transcriptional regulator [Streptomyces venezuelae]